MDKIVKKNGVNDIFKMVKKRITNIILTSIIIILVLYFVIAAISTLTLDSPVDYYNQSSTTGVFNCTATISDQDNLTNLSLYFNSTDMGPVELNQSNISEIISGVTYEFNISNIAEGSHNWTCSGEDNSTNEVWGVSKIITIDTTAPIITLDIPTNNSWSNDTNVTFGFIVSDNLLLIDTCELHGDFNTDFTLNQTDTSITNGTQTNFSLVVADNSTGYSWNIQCNDTVGNSAFNDSNFTVKVDATSPVVGEVKVTDGVTTLVNATDLNGTRYLKNTTIGINVTVEEINIDTVLLYYNLEGRLANTSDTSLIMSTLDSSSPYIYNATLEEGAVNDTNVTNFIIDANDTAGNIVTETQNENGFNFTIDGMPPIVSLISPANLSEDTGGTVIFNYNVSDSFEVVNCSLYLADTLNQTNSSITKDETQNFTVTNIRQSESLTWFIGCEDNATNQGNSTIYYLDTYANPGLSGGGSGISSTSSYSAGELTTEGKTKTLGVNEQAIFTFNGKSHKIKVDYIYTIVSKEVVLTISSEPITILIKIGETKEVDLDNDGVSDLSVTLLNLTDRKANLLIKKVGKKITEPTEKITLIEEEEKDEKEEKPLEITGGDVREEVIKQAPKKVSRKNWRWIILVIILLGGISYFLLKDGKFKGLIKKDWLDAIKIQKQDFFKKKLSDTRKQKRKK